MRPIIGITSFFEDRNHSKHSMINYDYVKAVKISKGLPLILPIITEKELIDQYINIIDGLIFSGGQDIMPILYGENSIDRVDNTCRNRDKFELSLFEKAYEKRVPMLGICRGMQLINVALGGTLYQDINNQIENSAIHRLQGINVNENHHRVKIIKASTLYNIISKENIEVNSIHHQSLKDIGKGLKVTAYSHDGIIEGIESLERDFLIGVQWHPERLIDKYPIFRKIFEAFVKKCSIYKLQ